MTEPYKRHITENSCFHRNGGSKGQNCTENQVFQKYLENASLDFFDFLHDARH